MLLFYVILGPGCKPGPGVGAMRDERKNAKKRELRVKEWSWSEKSGRVESEGFCVRGMGGNMMVRTGW